MTSPLFVLNLPGETSIDRVSLAWYEQRGYALLDKERRGKWGRTYDLMGFADGIFGRNGELLAAQWTDNTNFSKRVRKILDSYTAIGWLLGGGKIEVVGWRFHPVLKKWVARTREIGMEDFA